MTTLLKDTKTDLGSEPVYEIEVEYYKTDDDGTREYRDVYGHVTNISINNGNVFFNYKTKSIFNNSIFNQSLIFGEGMMTREDINSKTDSHTNIELQEIDNINIENMNY